MLKQYRIAIVTFLGVLITGIALAAWLSYGSFWGRENIDSDKYCLRQAGLVKSLVYKLQADARSINDISTVAALFNRSLREAGSEDRKNYALAGVYLNGDLGQWQKADGDQVLAFATCQKRPGRVRIFYADGYEKEVSADELKVARTLFVRLSEIQSEQ
jgi:hypothetical protein